MAFTEGCEQVVNLFQLAFLRLIRGRAMPTSTFHGYAPGALTIDPVSKNLKLGDNYKFAQDRVSISVTDNDNKFDGDAARDEVGDDQNQLGQVRDPGGRLLADGKIYVEEVMWFQNPSDPNGKLISVNVIEIGGKVVGYMPSEPLKSGVNYSYAGSTDSGDKVPQNGKAAQDNYSSFERNSVACFGPGTLITTRDGDIPVEWLEVGDHVMTRDSGHQPIIWIGRTGLPLAHSDPNENETTLCLRAGLLGHNIPTQDLHVTGDHRIFLRSAKAEALFGFSEALAPVKAWAAVGRATRSRKPTVLVHFMCAKHEIIMAQGAWVETMFPGPQALQRLDKASLTEIEALRLPDIDVMQTARPCLTLRESVLLLKMGGQVHAAQHADDDDLRSAG